MNTSTLSGGRISNMTVLLGVGAALVLIAWTSVMVPGFAFPWGNNVFHVPIVLDYASSAEGPHDSFTRSLDNFVSGFWVGLRLFSTEDNLFTVFFSAHIISRIAFVGGVFAIIRSLGANLPAALALAGMAGIAPLFKGMSVVGQTETLATNLTHTGFAIALLPLCWFLFLRGRWISGACAIGFLFNINAIISIWSVPAALAAFWMARESIPNVWRRLLLCGLGYAVFALPTALWTLSTLAEPSQPIAFRAYLLYYYPFHTFVHVQWDALVRYGAYLAAVAVAVQSAARDLGSEGRVLVAIFAAHGVIFVLGIPLPYLTDSRVLLNLYPLRLDAVINVSVAVITLAWAGRRMAEYRDSLPLAIALALLAENGVAALWLLLVWAHRVGSGFVTLTVLAAATALLVGFGLSPDLGDDFLPLLVIFAGASLCAAAASGAWAVLPSALAFAVSLSLVPGALSPWAGGAILALGLTLALPNPGLFRRAAVLASAPAALLGGLLVMGIGLSGYAVLRGSVERPDIDRAPDRQAQLWFRQNTPANTVFLPVEVNGFSLLSRRPAWVDHQAGAAVMWKPAYLSEWWPRIHALKGCKTEACYVDLARDNHVDWIVSRPDRFAETPGLHTHFINTRIRILRVDGVAPGRLEP